MHKQQVKILVKKLGNIPLSDITIKREAKKLFGNKFLKIVMQDSQIPNRDGYLVMNNDFIGGSGIHWIAIIKQGQNIYVYDSFGRNARKLIPVFVEKMINRGYKIYNTDLKDSDQFGQSVTCGHRCLSALMIAKDKGLKAFMSL